MPLLLCFIAIVAVILFWSFRVYGSAKGLHTVDRDIGELPRRPVSTYEDLVGTPLQRVRDPRLAATILMIQLVRTGSPLTASEKTRILEFMERPLRIDRISATFEWAWDYTQARLPFHRVADPLVPLLRESLTRAERVELVEMLTQVAAAHSAPSDLQREGIARLQRHLLAGEVHVLARHRGRSA